MNTRRHFIKCCGALLGSAAVPGLECLAASPAPDPLGFAAFSARLDSGFSLIAQDRSVRPVVLSKVAAYQSPHRPDFTTDENFTAHFASRGGEPLAQGTYLFRHPEMGEVPLFVVPHISPDDGRTVYVATFHGRPVTA